MNSVPNFLHPVAEYLSPVLKDSRFAETGVLTPEEFVAAGDYLVHTCATWAWQAGEAEKRRAYLPADKQFLITRHVPSLKRARALEYAVEDDDDEQEGADGWTVTHARRVDEEIPDMEVGGSDAANENNVNDDDDDDDIPDLDDFQDVDLLEEDDGATLDEGKGKAEGQDPDSNILKTRTYDISISYDKFYQTPRVWLFGFDENRQPLTPEQIFEDISNEMVNKTVTIESHPHISLSHASIHPCKHAPVMKRLIDQMKEGGIEVRVDQYLVVFLKFISSVLPTVEVEYHTV